MKRILIVEDEEAMQLGLGNNLKYEGYEVDFASDGEEGIQKIRDEKDNTTPLEDPVNRIKGQSQISTLTLWLKSQ